MRGSTHQHTRRAGLALAVIIATLAATSAPRAEVRTITPHPLGAQEAVYEHGRVFIVSRGARATVILTPEAIDRKRVWATLTFVNTGDRSFLVTERPLQAHATTSEGSKPVVVLDRAALEKKEKRKQMWENIAMGVAAGLNSYAASQQGHTTSTTHYNGRVTAYGSGGYAAANYGGTATTYSYNAAAASAAMAEAGRSNAALMGSLAAEQQARTNALQASVLNNHTLEPGQEYSGRVQLELPRRNRREGVALALTIQAGGESHPFLLLADGAAQPAVLSQVSATLEQRLPPAPRPLVVAESGPATPAPATTTSTAAETPAQAPVVAPDTGRAERIALLEAELAAMRAAQDSTPTPPAETDAAPVTVPTAAAPASAAAPDRVSVVGGFALLSPGTARHVASGNDWQIPGGGLRTWDDAVSVCKLMGAGWRLPSAGELQSLMAAGTTVRCGKMQCQAPSIFGPLPDAWAWSEETDGATRAFAASLANWAPAALPRTSTSAIALCVRSAAARG